MNDEFLRWRDAVVTALAAREDVLGVAGLGSTAATARADEWSDLDMFIMVSPGAEDRYRHHVDWLPVPDDVVAHLVEWHGGGKVLLRDGRFIEWGVGTPEAVSTWLAGEGTILFDRDGETATRALASAQRTPYPQGQQTEASALTNFVIALHHGMSRVRRGELVSGGEIIRSEAVAALLRAARAGLEPLDASALDALDVRRRVERAFPALASGITDAVAKDPESAAKALLSVALKHCGDRVPADAVAAVSSKFGWQRV